MGFTFKVLNIDGDRIIVDKVESVHRNLNWEYYTQEEIDDLNKRNNVSVCNDQKEVKIENTGQEMLNLNELRELYIKKYWKNYPLQYKNNLEWLKNKCE